MKKAIKSCAFLVCLMLALPALAETTVGDLNIGKVWAWETPGKVAAAYVTLTNTGEADDTLVAVTSDLTDRVELHDMVVEDDVMRMRPVDGIALPAGETVTLEEGGLHIMLMDLDSPLSADQTVSLTLEFATADAVTVPLKIKPRDGDAKDMHHHHDHGDDHADHDHSTHEHAHD